MMSDAHSCGVTSFVFHQHTASAAAAAAATAATASAVDVEALSMHISHPPHTSAVPVNNLNSGQASPETVCTSSLQSVRRASAELLPFSVKRQLFEQSAFASSPQCLTSPTSRVDGASP